MTKLEESFHKIKSQFPYLGDTIIFVRAIRGRKYSSSVIKKHYKKLCENEGLSRSEMKELINWFIVESGNTIEKKRLKKPL